MADVADQDADKARTYDHCRVEYAHLDTVMYIDTDELLFCPQVMKLPPFDVYLPQSPHVICYLS